jgi:DNA repair protein RecO
MCDLLSRVSLEHADQTDVYVLATDALNFLASMQPREALVFWFELRLLKTIGLSPRLDSCTVCRTKVPRTETVPFSHQNGGIVCRSCRSRSGGNTTILTPDIRATLNAWSRAPSPRVAHNTLCRPKQHLALCELFDIMFDHLGGSNTAHRQVLLDTLSFETGGVERKQ